MGRKMNIPTIHKKITSFLLGEEGKMSKNSIARTSAIIGSAVIISVITSKEVKSRGMGSHGNHNRHCSHISNQNYVGDCASHIAPANSQAHQNILNLAKTSTTATGSHNNCSETHASHNSSNC